MFGFLAQYEKEEAAMQLVEQHIISRDDPRFAAIDEAAFKSKNLYNYANYTIRQKFIFEGVYLDYNKMNKLVQSHEAYKVLPAKVSQQVLKQLDEDWVKFFESCKTYKECPEKFTGQPKLPKYKHKINGRNILVYTLQALGGGQTLKKGGNRNALQQGLIKPSRLPVVAKTKRDPSTINQARIVPRNGFYVVEVVYTKKPTQKQVDPSFCAALDLGVTNLAAITSNRKGFVPLVVNGRPLKTWNQWYNKCMKELRSCLPKDERDRVTKQMERITNKRNRRIHHYLHAASRHIIDFLVKQGVGTIIIGKNPLWKQEVGMGRRNNQNFVQIPHARFIDMLTYKAELVGIRVELQEESYTSKASFLDLDPIPVYKPGDEEEHTFSGKRIKRGLYRTKDGCEIHADVQGSYNILRKSRPSVFSKAEGVAGYVVHPIRLAVSTGAIQQRA
jgi:putative transposase